MNNKENDIKWIKELLDASDYELVNWIDKKLTNKFIIEPEIKSTTEITHLKLTIWNFITELKNYIDDKYNSSICNPKAI